MKYLWILLLLLPQFILAQQKELSLTDAIIGSQTYLSPEAFENIAWKDEDHFTYTENDTLWMSSVKENKVTVVISLIELKKNLLTYFYEFPEYSWLNYENIVFQGNNGFFIFNVNNKTITTEIKLGIDAENAEYCPENNKVAYTIGDNLYISDESGSQVTVTSDGGNGIVNGQYVHRNEFGIKKGIFWSPKGNLLAFYRKDESLVADYPLVDYMTRVAELKNIKYPMAGMTSEKVKIGVFNLSTQQTVILQTGEPLDHYLTNIAWSSDEKDIYVAEVNRDQNHMELKQYDAITGNFVRTLFEEKNEKYVEPMYPIQFSKVNHNEFYYLSRRDGWFHVYMYNTNGKLLKQITSGNWEVTKLLGFDEKEKFMFFQSTKESPLEKHIYKIDSKNGDITKLSSGIGIHEAFFNTSFSCFIDSWSGTYTPGNIDLVDSSGKLLRNLLTADNTLADYSVGTNEIIQILAADGKTNLYGRLIKPADFDSTKKYPVIIYVYGGPHLQLVDRSWNNGVRWWQYYMASKGFLLFTLDNRGSSNRGSEFENVIHRNLGDVEVADQMKGIDYLKSLPFVDSERIGVHGWSYGGFMTLNLKLRYPELFKVAVAGGPVVDWSLYEIMYGERYMDTPTENPEGYKKANMLNLVDKLQGKLILIHGAQDETLVMQQSMKFLRECIEQGKQVDFFVYPTHPHNVRNIDRVHLMEKVSNYFLNNL